MVTERAVLRGDELAPLRRRAAAVRHDAQVVGSPRGRREEQLGARQVGRGAAVREDVVRGDRRVGEDVPRLAAPGDALAAARARQRRAVGLRDRGRDGAREGRAVLRAGIVRQKQHGDLARRNAGGRDRRPRRLGRARGGDAAELGDVVVGPVARDGELHVLGPVVGDEDGEARRRDAGIERGRGDHVVAPHAALAGRGRVARRHAFPGGAPLIGRARELHDAVLVDDASEIAAAPLRLAAAVTAVVLAEGVAAVGIDDGAVGVGEVRGRVAAAEKSAERSHRDQPGELAGVHDPDARRFARPGKPSYMQLCGRAGAPFPPKRSLHPAHVVIDVVAFSSSGRGSG